MTEETFKKICSRVPKGVTVVTARRPCDGLPIGVTVSAFTGVSLQPPTVLICLKRDSMVTNLLLQVRYFAVNVLCEDQRDLSQRFATGSLEARFCGLEWREGLHSVPVLPGTLGHVVCEGGKSVADGDHEVVFGRVLEGSYAEGRCPLVYWASAYQALKGASPEVPGGIERSLHA